MALLNLYSIRSLPCASNTTFKAEMFLWIEKIIWILDNLRIYHFLCLSNLIIKKFTSNYHDLSSNWHFTWNKSKPWCHPCELVATIKSSKPYSCPQGRGWKERRRWRRVLSADDHVSSYHHRDWIGKIPGASSPFSDLSRLPAPPSGDTSPHTCFMWSELPNSRKLPASPAFPYQQGRQQKSKKCHRTTPVSSGCVCGDPLLLSRTGLPSTTIIPADS